MRHQLWCALALCLLSLSGWGQTGKQAELEAERKAISDRIARTQSLLEDARQGQQRSTQELALQREELALRQQLLANLTQERRSAERRLDARKANVADADAQLEALKEEYAAMIRVAARLNGGNTFWNVIFDADGMTQVFRRLMMIEEYGRTRREQAERIAETTDALRQELDGLRQERASLLAVEGDLRSARDAAKQGARRQEMLLTQLRSEEKSLKDQLAKEEARMGELGRAIDRLIAAANRSSDPGAGFAATPEGKIIGAEFQANKGKLPWPVAEGVIIGRFGTHPHPTLPGIKIERRGIDIATPAGSAVASVFSGRVSNVITIAGGGIAVMVDHGSHRTVYANLSKVLVKDGEDIRTGQAIGTVMDMGNGHRAHFEIWDSGGSKPLDPETWIAR